MRSFSPTNLLNSLVLLGASICAASCGIGSGTPNAGACPGRAIGQGTLSAFACNGAAAPSVSGVVTVSDQGGGSYCVNISGISYTGTCSSNLVVGVFAGSSYINGTAITQFTGTQNFFFTAPSAPQQVYYHCTLGQAAPVNDCAVAVLIGI